MVLIRVLVDVGSYAESILSLGGRFAVDTDTFFCLFSYVDGCSILPVLKLMTLLGFILSPDFLRNY